MKGKQKLDKIIETVESRVWQTRKASADLDIKKYLNGLYPGYDTKEQIWMYRRNYSTPKVCAECGGKLNDLRKNTCSHKCRVDYENRTGLTEKRVEVLKHSMKEKYGAENAAQVDSFQEKRKNTMKEKYGMLASPLAVKKALSRIDNLQIKGRKTVMEKYGVANPSQIEGHGEKVKQTLIKNYGVDNWFKTKEAKTKMKERARNFWDAFSPPNITITKITDGIETNPNKRITFICIDCGEKNTLPHETYKWRINKVGSPCNNCHDLKNGSLKEKQLREAIESWGIQTRGNDRSIISPYELDIVIENKKIAVEFCGLFWHNDLRQDKRYHLDKLEKANNAGYQLITIFEDEWEHNKDIVFARLKNALGIANESVVYARNTKIREIESKTAKEFCIKHHSQGYNNSSIKYGLFHNEELVSVMTFSKANASKGHKIPKWELQRFCSSTRIVGGASKLFKRFIKDHDPDEVISYCDRRWGTGDVYKQLGFSFNGNTSPNYWYIVNHETKRKHRFGLRKNKDDDPDLTEYENRLKQGYLRIWDCGSSKWIWTKK